MKKASVSLQLNWIFVILVGMALLGILFMQTQQSAQKSKYEANLKLRESLQGMLASVSSDNFKDIELGTVSILNDCEDGSSNLYIGKGLIPLETNYYSLHAPRRIASRNLLLQTVDNIPILTGQDHVYLFVNDYDEILDLFEKFEGRKQLIERNEIQNFPPDDSTLKYTMIFYFPNYNPQANRDLIEYNNVDYSFDIVIVSPSLNDGRSVVYFRTNQIFTESEPEDYLNEGELLGAIVDSNYDLYSCVHQKYIDRELLRIKLLQEKKNLMTVHASDSCANLLNHVDNIFDTAITSLEDSDEITFKQTMIELDKINLDLARNSCPIIK